MFHITDILKLMRPKSWIKNILVGLPMFFSLSLFNQEDIFPVFMAFIGFCLISSAIYALNDVFDLNYDRARDDRKDRPLASGRVPVVYANWLFVILALTGFACLLFGVSWSSWLYGLTYWIVNICYTMKLKHVPVLDVGCIAAGFVLRVYAGAAACDVEVSGWLFLTVASAALFMGFGKRYGEMSFSESRYWRESVRGYDLDFLRGAMFLSSGLAVGFYALWAMQFDTSRLVMSVPVLVLLLCRYLLDVFRNIGGGDPVRIFYADKFLSLGVIAYGILMGILLYF